MFFAVAITVVALISGNVLAQATEKKSSTKSKLDLSACQAMLASGAPVESPLKDMILVFRNGQPFKGEYESTVAFKERMKLLGAQAAQLHRSKTNRDEIILVRDVDPANTSYDADRTRLLVGAPQRRLLALSGPLNGLIVSNQSWAPGATDIVERPREVAGVRMRELTRFDHGLSSPPSPGMLGWPEDLEKAPIVISATPDQARALRSTLAVLLVAKLVEPYYQTSSEHIGGRASGRNRVDDMWIRVELLVVRYQCAALYDRAQNRIIEGIRLSQ